MKDNLSKDALNQFTFSKIPRRIIYHHFIRKFIVLLRYIQIKLHIKLLKNNNKNYITDLDNRFNNVINVKSIREISEDFRHNSFSFGNGLIMDSYLVRILSNWPPIYFLKPNYSIFKSYDSGFYIGTSFLKDTKFSLEKIEYFQHLKQMYKFLSSNEFANEITKLCNDGMERKFYSFLVTEASEGSGLLQHIDGAKDYSFGKYFLNLIIFLDGSDPPFESGGTSIYSSESPDSLLSSPKTLKNSFLIYKSSANLYHGFPPMKKDKYRKALLVQYAGKNL